MKRIVAKDWRFLTQGGKATHIQAQGSPFVRIKGIKETATTLEVKTDEYVFILKEGE